MRNELSIQREAACGTLIEAANHQFGFRLEYRNTQAGSIGGVAVTKRYVSDCVCIRICGRIACGLVNDAEVAVAIRQGEFRSTKNGKIWCRQKFQDCFPARFAYPTPNCFKNGFRVYSRGKRLRFRRLFRTNVVSFFVHRLFAPSFMTQFPWSLLLCVLYAPSWRMSRANLPDDF